MEWGSVGDVMPFIRRSQEVSRPYYNDGTAQSGSGGPHSLAGKQGVSLEVSFELGVYNATFGPQTRPASEIVAAL